MGWWGVNCKSSFFHGMDNASVEAWFLRRLVVVYASAEALISATTKVSLCASAKA